MCIDWLQLFRWSSCCWQTINPIDLRRWSTTTIDPPIHMFVLLISSTKTSKRSRSAQTNTTAHNFETKFKSELLSCDRRVSQSIRLFRVIVGFKPTFKRKKCCMIWVPKGWKKIREDIILIPSHLLCFYRTLDWSLSLVPPAGSRSLSIQWADFL